MGTPKRRMQLIVGLAGGLAVALTAAACGGSSHASPKSAFVASANQICKQANDDVGDDTLPGDPSQVTAQEMPVWATYLNDVQAAGSRAEDDLKKVKLPPGDQAAQQFVGAFSRLNEDVQAALQAGAKNDVSAFESALASTFHDEVSLKDAAHTAGAGDCAQ